MATRNRAAARERARAALAEREAARAAREKAIAKATEDFYASVDAYESAQAAVNEAAAARDSAVQKLAAIGLPLAEVATLTGMSQREVSSVTRTRRSVRRAKNESETVTSSTGPVAEVEQVA